MGIGLVWGHLSYSHDVLGRCIEFDFHQRSETLELEGKAFNALVRKVRDVTVRKLGQE